MTPAGDVRLEARVRGRVQGVGYRYFVLEWAAELNLRGWVGNEPDGAVTVVAEGPRDHLERLVAALDEGPASAHVEAVSAAWSAATGGFDRFGVRSRWHSGD